MIIRKRKNMAGKILITFSKKGIKAKLKIILQKGNHK